MDYKEAGGYDKLDLSKRPVLAAMLGVSQMQHIVFLSGADPTFVLENGERFAQKIAEQRRHLHNLSPAQQRGVEQMVMRWIEIARSNYVPSNN